MTKAKKNTLFAIIIILILVLLFVANNKSASSTKELVQATVILDQFASCISDSGAKFYGAFWCSHCKNQKEMFGTSEKLLPYVECSTESALGQLQVCKDADIKGYPTWVFGDQSRITGEISLQTLAEITKCELPQ